MSTSATALDILEHGLRAAQQLVGDIVVEPRLDDQDAGAGTGGRRGAEADVGDTMAEPIDRLGLEKVDRDAHR